MFPLLLTLSVLSAEPDAKTSAAMVAKIRNEDVTWNAGFVGITPYIREGDTHKCYDLGKPAIPALYAALEDPKRAVAAHVLLSEITVRHFGDTYLCSDPFNGLDLHGVYNTGDTLHTISADEQRQLQAQWKAYFQRKGVEVTPRKSWNWRLLK